MNTRRIGDLDGMGQQLEYVLRDGGEMGPYFRAAHIFESPCIKLNIGMPFIRIEENWSKDDFTFQIADSRRLIRATHNIPQSKILNLRSEIIEAPTLLSLLDTDYVRGRGCVSVTNAWWFVNGVFGRVSAN